MRISTETGRTVLAVVWVACFLVNVLIVVTIYWLGWIEEDNFEIAIKQLNGFHIAYVGAVCAFYFTDAEGKSLRRAQRAGMRFGLALGASVVWNVLVLVPMVRLLFGAGTIEESLRQISTVASALAWFVAPAIGVYFGSAVRPAKGGSAHGEETA